MGEYGLDPESKGGLKPSNIIIIVFVLAAVGVLAATWVQTLNDVAEVTPTAPTTRPTADVFCHIGSEKDDLMLNADVQTILREEYGLNVTTNNMGSIDQAFLTESALQSVDCLWPSNTYSLDIFAQENPDIDFSDAIIFNSPIVLYTWAGVLDGLLADGVVTQTADGYYVMDSIQMAQMLTADPRPTWASLGVNSGLSGSFNVVSSDPARSNSGNMFYALLLNALNGGDVATLSDLQTHLPTILDYYARQGLQQSSSGTQFNLFIAQGMGAMPIMANYESLIIEFSVANRDQLAQVQEILRIVYPQPTVWSSHPIIALTENGRRFLEAMQDPQIQQIAWEEHGFRSGIVGINNDPGVLAVAGIPAQVTSVISLPRSDAMLEMSEALRGN